MPNTSDADLPRILERLALPFRTGQCADLLLPGPLEHDLRELGRVIDEPCPSPLATLLARARSAELHRLRGDRGASARALGPFLTGEGNDRAFDEARAANFARGGNQLAFACGALAGQAAATLYKLYLYEAAIEAARFSDKLLSATDTRSVFDDRDKVIAQCSNRGWLARSYFRVNRREAAARHLKRAIGTIQAAIHETGFRWETEHPPPLGQEQEMRAARARDEQEAKGGMRLVLAHLVEFAAYCSWTLGDQAGHQMIYEALYNYGPPVNAPIPEGFACTVAARIESTRGEIGRWKALDLLKRAIQLFDIYGHPFRFRAAVQRAQVLCKADDLLRSERVLNQLEAELETELDRNAIDEGEAAYVKGDALLCRIWIAERHTRSKPSDAGWAQCLGLAEELASIQTPERLRVDACLHRGQALSQLHDKSARTVLEEALALAESQGRAKIQVAALLSLAENAERVGSRKEAVREHLDRAQRVLGRTESQFLSDWAARLHERLEGQRLVPVPLDAEATYKEAQEAGGRALLAHLLSLPEITSLGVLRDRLDVSRQTVYNLLERYGLRHEADRRFGRDG